MRQLVRNNIATLRALALRPFMWLSPAVLILLTPLAATAAILEQPFLEIRCIPEANYFSVRWISSYVSDDSFTRKAASQLNHRYALYSEIDTREERTIVCPFTSRPVKITFWIGRKTNLSLAANIVVWHGKTLIYDGYFSGVDYINNHITLGFDGEDWTLDYCPYDLCRKSQDPKHFCYYCHLERIKRDDHPDCQETVKSLFPFAGKGLNIKQRKIPAENGYCYDHIKTQHTVYPEE